MINLLMLPDNVFCFCSSFLPFPSEHPCVLVFSHFNVARRPGTFCPPPCFLAPAVSLFCFGLFFFHTFANVFFLAQQANFVSRLYSKSDRRFHSFLHAFSPQPRSTPFFTHRVPLSATSQQIVTFPLPLLYLNIYPFSRSFSI